MLNGEATNTNFIVFGLARPGQLRLKFPCIDHSIAEQTRNLLIRKELHKPPQPENYFSYRVDIGV